MTSPLIVAAKNGYYERVLNLLKEGEPSDCLDKDHATPLYWGASRGHASICRALLQAGSDANARVKWGSTALHAAADRGHLDCLNVLLESGVEVNLANERGDTALHLAAYRGFTDIVQRLMEVHADPLIKNHQSKTPLQEAVAEQHHGTAILLQDYVNSQRHLPFNSLPDKKEHIMLLPEPSLPARSWPQYRTDSRHNSSDSLHQLNPCPNTASGQQLNPCPNTASGQQLNPYQNTENVQHHYKASHSAFRTVPNESAVNGKSGAIGAVIIRRVHAEPQESIEHEGYCSNPQQLPYRTDTVNHFGVTNGYARNSTESGDRHSRNMYHQANVVQNTGRGAQSSRPEGHNMNCQARSLPPPLPMIPPRPPRSSQNSNTTMGIDDIIGLAESLQYEVVKLRTMLEQKENEISILGEKVAMKEKENVHLQEVLVTHKAKIRLITAEKNSELSNLINELGLLKEKSSWMHKDILPPETTNELSAMQNFEFLETKSSHCDFCTPQDVLVSRAVVSPTKCREGSAGWRPDGHETATACQIEKDGRKNDLMTCDINCYQSTTYTNYLVLLQSLWSQKDKTWIQDLKDSVRRTLRAACIEDVDSGRLDADGREWSFGKDYTLLRQEPINCDADGQRTGSCSLVFSILHKQRNYILKMMVNLVHTAQDLDSSNHDLDCHLLHSFGTEFHAPLLLHKHPNIVRVRHNYQGDTIHFRRYQSLLVPPNLDVRVEMAQRTTFLVLEHYPDTLSTLLTRFQSADMPECFFLHLLYQLLSAVDYLQRHHLVHRDIKEDNVFLDWRLRPMLGDFGMARSLRGYNGQSLLFSDPDQVLAGNSLAWAPELARYHRDGPLVTANQLTLEEVYSRSDLWAVGRMFYNFLLPERAKASFPDTSRSNPHYLDSSIPRLSTHFSSLEKLLTCFVRDDPSQRPTPRKALLNTGLLLLKPARCQITDVDSADRYCTARMMQLLALSSSRPSQPEYGTLCIQGSVAANQSSLEADFLLSTTPEEFCETLNEFGCQSVMQK